MNATGVPSPREKRFLPLKRRPNDITDAGHFPLKMRYCLSDPIMLSLALYLNPFKRYGRSKVCRPLRAVKGLKTLSTTPK